MHRDFSELIVNKKDKNRFTTSLNDRRPQDRRLKAAIFCRHFPSPARPKAVINNILTSIMPTFGQNLAYISDVLMGISFGLKDAYVQLQRVPRKSKIILKMHSPTIRGRHSDLRRFGHKRAVSALWLDYCGVALAK